MRPRTFLITLLTVIIGAGATLTGIFGYVSVKGYRSDAAPSDAIVVLGAAVWGEGKPSPALRGRTEKGIELFKKGMADHLVFSGGIGAGPPSEAEVMKRVAMSEGIPEEAIVLEAQAHNTKDSAEFVNAIALDHGWKSVLVVSDPFHTVRARILFQDAGLKVTTAPANDSYYSTGNRIYYTMRETAALVVYAFDRLWG